MEQDVQAVLDFWFGPQAGASRPEWFRKSDAFDRQIRERFGALHDQAAAGGLAEWEAAPRSALALLVLLDQFSRNLHRNDARAFAQDARALRIAKAMVERGWDRELLPVQRQFVYLPFEHAEDLAAQDRAMALFGELESYPETRDLVQWAEKHRVIIRRFGRFPHRNAALGRASTPEEVAFLREPGSGF
jgi:uncharacterized protein (DUF924 family)